MWLLQQMPVLLQVAGLPQTECKHKHSVTAFIQAIYFSGRKDWYPVSPRPQRVKASVTVYCQDSTYLFCPLEMLRPAGWQNISNLITQAVIRACLNFHTGKNCSSSHEA